jgi:hypothetical protein
MTPAPCDPRIFKEGVSVAAVYADGFSSDGKGGSIEIERWVRSVADKANASLDWHYSGGIGNVLFLGDAEARQRVEIAIDALTPTLAGRVMVRYGPGAAGLYREGVTAVPEGTRAVFMDPLSGEQVAIVTQSSRDDHE